MRMQSTSGTSRAGLSLLEVILSLSILGVSMVAVGHLFNLGFRSATDVQLRSEANMIADTTICLLYTSPSPRDRTRSRMPSSA